jgi:acetyl-CoA acetyltransferase family protein
MPQPVVIDAVRTPFGRKGSTLREVRPDSLLARSLAGLVERVGIDPAKIEDVITGCVSQAGEQGANVGRLATFLAGFPVEVPAVSLNRMCGSSQQAIHFAAQAIGAGDAFYTIGCGVESMTRVPMFSDVGSLDKLNPELAKFNLVHQGESAELLAEKYKITRSDVDEFSKESHRRAALAIREGRYKEILPTAGVDGEGKALTLDRDEGVRDTIDPEKMASLKTVFRPNGNGVVTAANSSQISDGSSAVPIARLPSATASNPAPGSWLAWPSATIRRCSWPA